MKRYSKSEINIILHRPFYERDPEISWREVREIAKQLLFDNEEMEKEILELKQNEKDL